MASLDRYLLFIPAEASPSNWIEPITVAEAKANSRVDDSAEDSLFELLLIPAARRAIEAKLDKKIGSQEWEVGFRFWPGHEIEIPIPLTPLQSVESIKYTDRDGVEHVDWDVNASPPVVSSVFAASLYSSPGFLHLLPDQVLPSTDLYPGFPIRIRVIVGIPIATIGEHIKQACLLTASHLFEHREAVSSEGLGEVPMGAMWLIESERSTVYP